ncbi:MAG: ankyrin repeat domain-containing protein, partial [Bacteroidota bacterium]|nr:ankyrin repeat domain-containing protein [Bacteroidota bacterium]
FRFKICLLKPPMFELKHIIGLLFFLLSFNSQSQEDSADYDLLKAAYDGKTHEVVMLIKDSTDVNFKDAYGCTALIYASQQGHIDIVKILHFNGAKINDKVRYGGNTALMIASKHNRHQVVNFLIKKGAKINEKNSRGLTPLHYSTAYGYDTTTDMLLYYGADISIKDNDSNTAFIISSFTAKVNTAKLLLDYGAKINEQDKNGLTALMIASQNRDFNFTKFLLENKANKKIKNKYNHTALFYSVYNNDTAITNLLLNDSTEKNLTKLIDLAYKNENYIMAKLLKEESTKVSLMPVFNKLILSYGSNFSKDDLLFNTAIGLHDSKYLLNFNLGFDTRYKARKILVKESENNFFQFHERRFIFYTNLEKEINLYRDAVSVKGCYLGFKEGYTFGNYRGAEEKAVSKFLHIPQIGLFWKNQNFALRTAYEYYDLGIYNHSPHHLSLQLNYFLRIGKEKIIKKEINLL